MYDEAIDVVDAEEVSTPRDYNMSSEEQRNSPVDENLEDSTRKETQRSDNPGQWSLPDRGLIAQLSDRSENSDDDEDDDDVQAPTLQGAYDPSDYDQLAVSSEVKELFSNITKYISQTIELNTKLAPFLPDLIPAVGDIDGFLKVPRPDGVRDTLGLLVLDEPCTIQTDPVVLQLQLRAQAKQTEDKKLVVKKINNADANVAAINNWVNAISDLHQKKPPPSVHYTRPMPTLDSLMEEWPKKMEQQFESLPLPSPDLDCDLSTYVTILCNLFDIPVYENKLQSLHLFFSLYSTMRSTRSQLVQDGEEDDDTQATQ